MNNLKLPLISLLVGATLTVSATHDYFLLPDSFLLHKGQRLNLNLFEGDQFVKQIEVGTHARKKVSLTLFPEKKKFDLIDLDSNSQMLLMNYPVTGSGQHIVTVATGSELSNSSREDYSEFLNSLGYNELAEKVKNGKQISVREKHTSYMKTLFCVDDNDGKEYRKEIGQVSEIILKDNPYRKRFEEDLVAQLLIKGKPAKGERIFLYIKMLSGKDFSKIFTTDDKGEVNINMSYEGLYMLRSVHVEATSDKDADYISWWTTFTFSFTSSNEALNDYRGFGLGNIH